MSNFDPTISRQIAKRLSDISVCREDDLHPEFAEIFRVASNEVERCITEIERLTAEIKDGNAVFMGIVKANGTIGERNIKLACENARLRAALREIVDTWEFGDALRIAKDALAGAADETDEPLCKNCGSELADHLITEQDLIACPGGTTFYSE